MTIDLQNFMDTDFSLIHCPTSTSSLWCEKFIYFPLWWTCRPVPYWIAHLNKWNADMITILFFWCPGKLLNLQMWVYLAYEWTVTKFWVALRFTLRRCSVNQPLKWTFADILPCYCNEIKPGVQQFARKFLPLQAKEWTGHLR